MPGTKCNRERGVMRAYVTGATGFVGSNIAAEFASVPGTIVHCPVRSSHPDPRLSTESLDLLDSAAVHASVDRYRPDVIVHSMILNDHDLMYEDRDLAWRSFVGTTETLSDAADRVGATLILVSTDWVFDGTQGPAAEDTPPNPINLYGVLKMASELVLLERCERGAVARVSGVQGHHRARPTTPRSQDLGYGYLAASIVDALSKGERFTVWEADDINNVATLSLASETGRTMHAIACLDDPSGIFHCCGSEPTTRRELAYSTCDVFGLDSDLLRFGPPDDLAMRYSVPYDTSLSTDQTVARLGTTPLTTREILEGFRTERSVIGAVA
ncbi:MAG: sugar nucleotide-binding protein [Ilumatobacter sp.]